jgi:thioredoxin-related protein
VVAVAPYGDEAGIRDLFAEKGYSLPVVLAKNSVFGDYGVRGVPTLAVLDQNGATVQSVVGPVNVLRLSRILDDLAGG